MDQDVHGVKNYNIAVKKRGERYHLPAADCAAARRMTAYGIEVAKLAGLPEAVIKRAHARAAPAGSQQLPAPQQQGQGAAGF